MEIERKFLTEREKIPFDITAFPCMEITQAYIGFSPVIRIRRSNDLENAGRYGNIIPSCPLLFNH